MKFFEFIFLKRRLEHDKDNIVQNLEASKKRGRPMWLVLFPEGTGKKKKGILGPIRLTCYKNSYI
jgi:1-acyl-sn-glycerol-3-phosphate acyltransferase